MKISKVFPSIEKPIEGTKPLNHTCPQCGRVIVLEVDANCPEDWITELLSITGCNECVTEFRRERDAIETKHKLITQIGIKKQSLRSAKRKCESHDYKTSADARDSVSRLEPEIRKLKQLLNDLDN